MIAQVFYVGAQIMCWTFIIHYGMTEVGLTASEAQNYNIVAMCFSGQSLYFFVRFYLINAALLLMIFAIAAASLTFAVIFTGGMLGLYCLIAVSGCMSLMFPTIYGISLGGLKADASIASSGLVMAIVGGALMPPLQGQMIDAGPLIKSLSAVQTSFLLPLISFMVIAVFALSR